MSLTLALLLSVGIGGPRTVRVTVAPHETLTVRIQGAGAPVALIPGLVGSAYGFRHVTQLLAEAGYQTIIIEPLAMGTSSRPRGADYSLSAQATRIAAILDTLHLRGVIVVGHSAGAAIAFRMVVQRPELVRAIVSLEGGPAEHAATPMFRRTMTLAPMIRLAGAGFFRGRIRRALLQASGDTSWVTDDVIAQYTAGATADLSATLKAWLRMAEAREPERIAPRLSELRCPVHLLLGGAPHVGTPNAPEREAMREFIAGLVTETVPGAGHYLHEERPDRVVAAVRGLAAAGR